MIPIVDVAVALREGRMAAGLTQAALARRAGTSQATVSAYESGRKRPGVETFSRLLAASGARLAIEPARPGSTEPSAAHHARTARRLVDVLALAAALPVRHEPELRFPRLG